MDGIEHLKNPVKADVVFCCVGTTNAKTPDKEKYRAIDYGIPLKAAEYCKKNGVGTLIVISAMGADPKSKVFYNRLKGEMERDVLKVGIKNTFFMQPSLIAGDRKEKRTFEYITKQMMKFLNFFLIGPAKKYRSIHADTIAEAMIHVDLHGYEKARIQSDEIQNIADGTRWNRTQIFSKVSGF